MKLVCNVKVSHRLVADPSKNRSVKTSLAISRNSVKDNDFYILLQTLQNKTGTKYKVNDNISQVYNKYVEEGKTTISFVEPPHNLVIQCDDIIQLKSFLRVLKLGLEKKTNLAVLPLSNGGPKDITNILTKSQNKITIKEPSKYPTLKGFPKSCKELYVAGLQRRTFDRQILQLQSLRILDLSQNNLTNLPKELGDLKHLANLYLAGNQLGKAPLSKWAWLASPNLAKTLCCLDISNNQITVLPHQIGNLGNLRELKVAENLLRVLPQSVGRLTRLKNLDIAENQIQFLPGSMRHLRLESLDIAKNEFTLMENQNSQHEFNVPSLVEIAARAVIQSRKHYNASIIPLTLVTYLDHARYCVCGGPCFECSVHLLVILDMSMIAQSVRSSANSTAAFDCYFCSPTCLRRYAPRAALK